MLLLNNMASSAILFRRWSAAQFFRSRAVAKYYFSYSLGKSGCELASANRMITTTSGGVCSPKSPAAPWLMMKPCGNFYTGETVWRFYCFAKDRIFSFIPDEHSENPNPQMNSYSVELVGSSHGWLALYDKRKSDLFLHDPITNRELKLPPLIEGEEIHLVVLSDSDEREGKAFLTFGSGHSLALCSLGGRHGWTLFGGGDYQSVVYSSGHRRLFCLTSTLELEAWDVGGESQTPRLDRASARFEIPVRPARTYLTGLNYIVCEEQSGELYLVVRHVRLGGGSWVERGVERVYVRPTVDFDVYKIDEGSKKLTWMEDCLGGLTMFVGIGDAIAARDVGGEVKPDTIYFGYDSRARAIDGDNDYGVFDYRKKGFCRHKNSYKLHEEELDGHPLRPIPVWFTPRRFQYHLC